MSIKDAKINDNDTLSLEIIWDYINIALIYEDRL